MRPRAFALTVLTVLALSAAAATRARAPRQANVTGACTPQATPQITPPTIAMQRSDIVVWGSVSSNATSWTITPKDTLDWPWSQRSFTGTPRAPATTPQPLASALANHPYRYNVRVQCADGTAQNIDPDIVIGDGE
jgi:hypothetical protein